MPALRQKNEAFASFMTHNFFLQFQNQAKKDFVISRKNIFMDFLQICETCRQPRRGGVDLTHGSYLQQKRPKFVVTFQKCEV